MAKNDTVLLDGILEQRISEGTLLGDKGEAFEYFALEQILKDYDLSQDELESGQIDGRGDGGFDGFYIFINGILLESIEDFVWPKANASIEIYMISCKHHDTFLQATLDAMLATIQEFFDLAIESSNLQGTYSAELLECRFLFTEAYKKLAIGRPIISFSFVYSSRGDSNQVGESVRARASQIEALIASLFSSSVCNFTFVGASELVALYRQAKTFSLDLPFLEHLATGKDSYVLLTRLDNYWRFVCDDHGNLRRYLFDSNVRDFLGASEINKDIANSLLDDSGPDFWWLNNGVTILATSATIPGKTIQLKDIQIVNGLQTTETIYHHFKTGSTTSGGRSLLVKIIVSSDSNARDQIIRATNNQNAVDLAALHATDKIQRDIEAILESHNWYYERRRNYYRYIGKPQARFLTPVYLASASIALVLKNPRRATRLRARFMRIQESYDAVFSSNTPIEVWPAIVTIYKQTDAWLVSLSSKRHAAELFLPTWRPLLSLLAASRVLGTFAYKTRDLTKLTNTQIDHQVYEDCWEVVDYISSSHWPKRHPSFVFVRRVCLEASKRFGLRGVFDVARQDIALYHTPSQVDVEKLTPEFIADVDKLLPAQPWQQAVHIKVADALECKPHLVSIAIQMLIADKRRNIQIDGVVYDDDGNIVAADPARVPVTNIEETDSY